MRSPLVVAVLIASIAFAGCASETSDASAAPVDETNAASLRAATTIEGTTAVGAPITVKYDRADGYKFVPYLAVAIDPGAAPAGGTPSINVDGDFPGSPDVIVVDDQYVPLASKTVSARGSDGVWTSTTVLNQPHQGMIMVIVHDQLWSKPMSFQVAASVASK